MRLLALAITLPLIVTAALAQTPGSKSASSQSSKSGQGTRMNPGSTTQGGMQGGMSGQAMQQQVRKNLQQAGFTDIQVMPSSFLVRAKNKQGNKVMMIINPDSVTAVTAVPNSTTGQGGPASKGNSASPGSRGSSPEASPSGK